MDSCARHLSCASLGPSSVPFMFYHTPFKSMSCPICPFHVPSSPYGVALYSPHVSRCHLKSLKPSTCLPHFPLCLFTSPSCTVLPPLVYLFILQSTSCVRALASSPCPDLPGSFFHPTFPDPCRNYFSLLPRTPRSLRLLVFSFLSTTEINKT